MKNNVYIMMSAIGYNMGNNRCFIWLRVLMTTSYTQRTPVNTAYTQRTNLFVSFLTLITGKFTDGLEYIITDQNENALIVNDYTWYKIDIPTIYSGRTPVISTYTQRQSI